MGKEDDILKLIKSKGSTTVEAFEKSKAAFMILKKVLQLVEQEVKSGLAASDARIPMEFDDKGRLEVHFKFADDVLVFLMHTNIFTFDASHHIHQSTYVKENPLREFCGMIYVYNFLYESVKFNRQNDMGVLVARMFINKENHFFVEGKKQIGLLFNDFAKDTISEDNLRKFVDALMLFVLEIDFKIPPYDAMIQTTLQDITENTAHNKLITGKRFGFVIPGSEPNPTTDSI